MSLGDLTDPEAVRRAIAEFDQRGRAEFLRTYGFGRARDYFILDDGKRYDSKAIAGVAHLYQHGILLTPSDFSGGDITVANRLENLGFAVTRPVDLPDWCVDELILALDLYLRTRGLMSITSSASVVCALSDELRSLHIFPEYVRADPRFRNPAGVALKLHNFSSIDPDYAGKGMGHGGAGDRAVWDEWAGQPEELAKAVALVRGLGASADLPKDTGEDEEYSAPEGRILYRNHRRLERDKKLVARKKSAALKRLGRLACEVCDFDSAEAFNIEGVIDVHHVVPLHRIGESETSISDLALVCPTCHRVLHKHRPMLTPAQLRARRGGGV